MNYHFKIEYHTKWGEELKIVGNIPQLGDNDPEAAVPMHTQNGQDWEVDIEFDQLPEDKLRYNYLLIKDGQIIRSEYHLIKHQLRPSNDHNLIIEDTWIDKPKIGPLYSSAFTDVWNKRDPSEELVGTTQLELSIIEANIHPNETLAVVGNTQELGNWEIKKAKIMNDSDFPRWRVALEYPAEPNKTLEYKYVILNKTNYSLVEWEKGENRTWTISQPASQNTRLIKSEVYTGFYRLPWQTAGVAVPVFSLRSERSWGIGEFLDLKLLVDWAVSTQQRIIQILPINDTTSSNTWGDAYPYRCISVFALNPIYLNLDELGIADTSNAESYQKDRKRINQLKTIDFPYVQAQKQIYTEAIFKFKAKETFESKPFKEFYQEQKHWLVPYAIYLHLRETYKTSETQNWGKHREFKTLSIKEFDTPAYQAYEKLQYTYFIQYHLYRQLKEASAYANNKGVVLKGDLPIGIGLHSADAWTHPEFFHIDCQAGAPPDDFAQEGQNWGFPTYNWENISKDNFGWWKDRLQYMAEFFQAYRIDHILGFFRIWSIPRSAIYGTLGQFSPALPLSIEEISAYGFDFNKELYTRPFINEHSFQPLAEQDKKMLITTFFIKDNDQYKFKKEFDTQAKLRSYFEANPSSMLDANAKDLLMACHAEVLFIEDLTQSERYHPRIDAFKTRVYKSLSEQDKLAFDTLYHHFFYERHNEFWKNEALAKLPQLIGASNMLVCGEDLGMIPKTVPQVMNELDILSLEIQRMPKEQGEKIADPANYPYLSVSTFSTHDMSTLRGWWEEEYTNQKLTPDLAYSVLNRELCGRSILVVESLQDWMALTSEWYDTLSGEEEQINIPANSNHRWKFRMAGYLEDLIQNKKLNDTINELIANKQKRNE